MVVAELPKKLRPKVEYPNFWSRLIVGPMFKRQFVIPERPPRPVEAFLTWYENTVIRPNVSNIKVDRPIFLIGLPRSGTSMLQDLICAHPHLAYITNSIHQFRTCFCAAEVWRKRLRLDARGERYVGDSVIVEAGTPADAVASWMEWLKWEPTLEYRPRTLADFTPEHVEKVKLDIRKIVWCFGPEASRFFTKCPGLVPEILLLKEMFPDARFVHIIRDPRACANSLLKLYRTDKEQLTRLRPDMHYEELHTAGFIPYPRTPNMARYVEEFGADNIRCTAHLWNDAVTFVTDRKEQLLPNYHEVRYEDICANPREEIFKIMDFCELPPVKEDNQKFWDLLNKVGVVHHSNKYSDFEVIEEICRDVMRKHGYV